jgi:hypothetical protein
VPVGDIGCRDEAPHAGRREADHGDNNQADALLEVPGCRLTTCSGITAVFRVTPLRAAAPRFRLASLCRQGIVCFPWPLGNSHSSRRTPRVPRGTRTCRLCRLFRGR